MTKTLASACRKLEIPASSYLIDPRFGTCVLDAYNIEYLLQEIPLTIVKSK